ncbi:MAG: MgtC/SapB family protein [Verrucomicrobiales bacterium]|nr:MgtC/SapB family protein [Verrucomicrobiales bacterium]
MFADLFQNPVEQLYRAVIVFIAAVLAGLVGIEREYSGKPAGFRTHMLVGGASALLVVLGEVMVKSFAEISEINSLIRSDPIRIIEAIIVGISFIGAGTVLKVQAEQRVRYLTTAASILFSAGIGVSVALGEMILAVVLVGIVVTVNLLLRHVDTKI